MKYIRTMIISCGLFGLVACDTTADTINSEPYFSSNYSTPREELVSCITSELILMGGVIYNVSTRPSDNVTIIAVNLSATALLGNARNERLSIIMIDDEEVVGRKNPWVVGKVHDTIQNMVVNCAKG